MGWLFGFSSASDVKDSLNRERSKRFKIVDQASTNYGRHLWTVLQPAEGKSFIVLDLLEKHEGDWGYKDITEDMHPFYYDCPLRLIEAAGPTDHEESNKWRAAVIAHREQQKRTFDEGSFIECYGTLYQVVEKKGRSMIVRRMRDRSIFKMTPKHIAACKPAEAPAAQGES